MKAEARAGAKALGLPGCALLLVLLLPALAGCSSPSTACAPTIEGGVCFETSDGWILQGAIWRANATDAPWALLVHGLNEDHRSFDALARDLRDAGWNALALDSRGHGGSTNRGNVSAFDARSFLGMERDLDAAGAWIGHAPNLTVGASLGANEALRHAAKQPDPQPAVVLLSPGLDDRGLAALPASAQHQAPALMLSSQEDEYARDSQEKIAAAHQGDTTAKVLPGDAHGTELLGDGAARARIVAWITRLGVGV